MPHAAIEFLEKHHIRMKVMQTSPDDVELGKADRQSTHGGLHLPHHEIVYRHAVRLHDSRSQVQIGLARISQRESPHVLKLNQTLQSQYPFSIRLNITHQFTLPNTSPPSPPPPHFASLTPPWNRSRHIGILAHQQP